MDLQSKPGSFVLGSHKVYFLHSDYIFHFIIIFQDVDFLPTGPYKLYESRNYVSYF